MSVQTLADYQAQVQRIVFPTDGDIDAQIEALDAEFKAMLPVERNSQEQLAKYITELKLARMGIYDKLPMDPLRERNKAGQPIFAVFRTARDLTRFGFTLSIDEGDIRFNVVGLESSPYTLLKNCFSDIEQHLLGRAPKGFFGYKDCEISMFTEFTGMIPTGVRKKIVEAQEAKIFTGIFLVAEANAWEYVTHPVPAPAEKVDPLVVGYAHEQLYLIDAFDLTTPEQVWIDRAVTGS